MFEVFDNDKPASEAGFPTLKGKGWTNHRFSTFAEAVFHVRHWLGMFSECCPTQPNVKVDYSGYGDFIEIRTEQK